MSNADTVSITCAALAGVVLLIIIVIWVRQTILRRRGTPVAEVSESADAVGTAEVHPEVVPDVVPAAIPAAAPAPQPVQEPQVVAVKETAIPEPVPAVAPISEPVTSQAIVSHLKS